MSLFSTLLRLGSRARPDGGAQYVEKGGRDFAAGRFDILGGAIGPEGLYVIWSNDHRGWWKPNEGGYTRDFFEAGLYSRQVALSLCIGARRVKDGIPDELALPHADAEFILEGSY